MLIILLILLLVKDNKCHLNILELEIEDTLKFGYEDHSYNEFTFIMNYMMLNFRSKGQIITKMLTVIAIGFCWSQSSTLVSMFYCSSDGSWTASNSGCLQTFVGPFGLCQSATLHPRGLGRRRSRIRGRTNFHPLWRRRVCLVGRQLQRVGGHQLGLLRGHSVPRVVVSRHPDSFGSSDQRNEWRKNKM